MSGHHNCKLQRAKICSHGNVPEVDFLDFQAPTLRYRLVAASAKPASVNSVSRFSHHYTNGLQFTRNVTHIVPSHLNHDDEHGGQYLFRPGRHITCTDLQPRACPPKDSPESVRVATASNLNCWSLQSCITDPPISFHFVSCVVTSPASPHVHSTMSIS